MNYELKLLPILLSLQIMSPSFFAQKALAMNFIPGANDRLKKIIEDDRKTASLAEVEQLLQGGANPNRYLGQFCPSYLHLLASKDKYSSLVEVLLKNGAHPNLRDHYQKETPLHIASRYVATQNIAHLLKHNAAVNALNKDNCTPLHVVLTHVDPHAHTEQDFICAKMLVEAGAALSISSTKGIPGGTPMELAKKHNWNRFINFVQSYELHTKLRCIKRDKNARTYLALLPAELLKKIASYEIVE